MKEMVGMSNQENKERPSQGFDGLSSMVSDVDSTVENAQNRSQSDTTPTPTLPKHQASRTSESTIYQHPISTSGGVPVFKWILIIGVIILLGSLFFSVSGQKKTPVSASANSYLDTVPINSPKINTQSERFSEQMPSIGTNNILDPAEIRYCIAEDIRIKGANSVIDNYDKNSVNRFNRIVDNYNSRCSEFRYRRGALELATSAVEPYRSALLAEGRSRL